MRYEPVGYIYAYEIGALLVFLVIMLRYFSARRFPNRKNRLFALILWASVADIVLDTGSSHIIDNVFRVPLHVTYIVNMSFYIITILMLMLMMLYTLVISGDMNRKRLLRASPLFLPGAAVLALMATNPKTHWFFYVDAARGYVHGTLFILVYITSFLYLMFTFLIARINRPRLKHGEYSTIVLFLSVVLLSTLIQYFCPTLLMTGVAIILAVVLMYFTIQNPEAMMDATTDAFTYEAMLTFLQDRLEDRERVKLIAVKIRNMSRVNDLLGIGNGSRLLRQVSHFLRDSANGSWVFRMRGSCFVAVTQKSADYHALCTALEERIGRPWAVDGTEVLLQAAVCRLDTETLLSAPISPDEAVRYLETAFALKDHAAGRIAYVDAGARLIETVRRNGAVEAALRSALADGEGLELYFQPLWSVRRNRFVSAEVLLRFQHPEMGYISPEEFVPIAESNGLVTAMDELVVRKTCAFIRDHGALSGYGLDTLEINLSALEFMHRRLPELLKEIMAQYRVHPEMLCFEVTETAATESFALLQECMAAIKALGCRFALDDFGTGYANISQVIQLPFTVVKLDKSMLNGPAAVLEDLVRMFARIERQTVVEGVSVTSKQSISG